MADIRTNSANRTDAGVGRAHDPTIAQRASMVVGIAFLLVGILGFVPGVTQNLGDITFAGHHSDAELLGVFEVSILHNIVHLLFGVIGVLAARRFDAARTFLFAGGAVYLILAAYGAVTAHDSDANFVPVNSADDLLHLGLGLGMIALGAIATAMDRDRTNPSPAGASSAR